MYVCGEGGWVIENRYALRSYIFILSLHLYVVILLKIELMKNVFPTYRNYCLRDVCGNKQLFAQR